MPEYAVGLLEGAHGDLDRRSGWPVLGAAYRGGVKETAFSGVFATVDGAARRAARTSRVHDPLYSRRRARRARLRRRTTWASRSTPSSSRPTTREYRDLTPTTCPGVRVLVDGRRVTDPAAWAGVTRRVIGAL